MKTKTDFHSCQSKEEDQSFIDAMAKDFLGQAQKNGHACVSRVNVYTWPRMASGDIFYLHRYLVRSGGNLGCSGH